MRERLSERRYHETIWFSFRGMRYTAGLGFSRRKGLAEVFLDCSKMTTDAANDARDIAVLLSVALQHGVAVETIREAVTRLDNGEPAGLLGKFLDVFIALEEAERPSLTVVSSS